MLNHPTFGGVHPRKNTITTKKGTLTVPKNDIEQILFDLYHKNEHYLRSNFNNYLVLTTNDIVCKVMQNQIEEAKFAYAKAIEITKSRVQKHKVFHNLGNVFMKEKNYELINVIGVTMFFVRKDMVTSIADWIKI